MTTWIDDCNYKDDESLQHIAKWHGLKFIDCKQIWETAKRLHDEDPETRCVYVDVEDKQSIKVYFDGCGSRYITDTRIYELSILFSENLSSNEARLLSALLWGVAHAKMLKYADDGVKRLAYDIKSHDKARYVYMELELTTPQDFKLLDDTIDKWVGADNDYVLSYLLIKQDPKTILTNSGKGR